MNPLGRGFLLLTSHLGNPDRRPLSPSQLRSLALRVRREDFPGELRDLEIRDLLALGYSREMAAHMASLLNEEALLDRYLEKARMAGCLPVTRADEAYPMLLRRRLGLDSPGCLWARGDLSLLNTPAIALVGSRDLLDANRAFAQAVGQEAAGQGLTLVSGNARGADRTAQDACLRAGGSVISLVADELTTKAETANILYLSEEDYDAPFTAQRALSRNRCIHCLGRMVWVAQCTSGRGGTWDGTVKNLRSGWSEVACFDDGSEGSRELEALGATLVTAGDLKDMEALTVGNTFFDMV